MPNRLLRSIQNDQRGITGLETAIILIAFIVVASVFAYSVLTAGIFASEKGKEAVYSGLETARSSMFISGPIIANDTDADNEIETLTVVVGNALNGEAINLTVGADGDSDGLLSDEANPTHKLVMTYIDSLQRISDITWSASQIGKGDDDALLEDGEKFELTIQLTGLTTALGPGKTFVVEIQPENGAAILLERRTPGFIDPVMDLR